MNELLLYYRWCLNWSVKGKIQTCGCIAMIFYSLVKLEIGIELFKKHILVRSGIRTHALIRGPEFSYSQRKGISLESGALNCSAIVTCYALEINLEWIYFGIRAKYWVLATYYNWLKYELGIFFYLPAVNFHSWHIQFCNFDYYTYLDRYQILRI